jgi:DNA repair exonuclease SbcCD ATPase subunit
MKMGKFTENLAEFFKLLSPSYRRQIEDMISRRELAIKKLEKEINDKIVDLKKMESALKSGNTRLKGLTAKQKFENEGEVIRLEVLASKLSTEREELAAQKKKFSTDSAAKTKAFNELQKTLEAEMAEKQADSKKKVSDATKVLELAKAELAEVTAKVNLSKSEHSKLEKTYQQLLDKAASIKNDEKALMESASANIEKLKKEQKDLSDKIRQLKKELEEKQAAKPQENNNGGNQ